MKARVYYSPWTLNVDAITGQRRVTSDVAIWLDENAPGVASTHMVWPDADLDGLPDGPRVITFIRVPDALDIGPLDNLSNTFAFPTYDLSTPMDSIPNGVKNQWRNAITGKGAPASIVEDAVIVRDVAVALMQWINPIAGTVPSWPSAEFGA